MDQAPAYVQPIDIFSHSTTRSSQICTELNIFFFAHTELRASMGFSPPCTQLRPTQSSANFLQPGRGFVFVPDAEKYNLLPGQPTPWGEIYSVSLFHQLHCLAELRKYHFLMLDSIFSNDSATFAAANKKVEHLLGQGNGGHAGHCFEYLRQGIMCSGDMTLEWPKLGDDGRRIEVDGWDIPHVCKSWVSTHTSFDN